jgi:hypothetical protein
MGELSDDDFADFQRDWSNLLHGRDHILTLIDNVEWDS